MLWSNIRNSIETMLISPSISSKFEEFNITHVTLWGIQLHFSDCPGRDLRLNSFLIKLSQNSYVYWVWAKM